MACTRKQGRALCFCAQLEQEGGNGRRAEDGGDMRIADCLQEEHDGGGNGRKKRAKRRELVVSLPPTSVSAGTPCDSYSPRTLLSRLLVSLQRPSPLRSGDGGEGMGCRVRFPRYGFSRREKEKIEGEEEEEVVAMVDAAVAEKVEGRSSMALDSHGGDEVVAVRSKSSTELSLSSGKRPNGEQSLNLGMGVGMVFLLSRSASELNKMTELREQMEVLLREIKNEVQKKDTPHSYTESNKTVSSASGSHGNSKSSCSNKLQRGRGASRNREVLLKSMEHSTSATPTRSKRCLNRNQMEAELEVELERLQIAVADKSSLVPPNRVRMQSEPVKNNGSKGLNKGLEEEDEDEDAEDMNSIQCGVSARELERRLNQLLKTRQLERIAELEASFNCDADPSESESFSEGVVELNETGEESGSAWFGFPARELEKKLYAMLETKQKERITELESALECAQRRLLEKEREVCWWRDTARLVSQRRDEALYR